MTFSVPVHGTDWCEVSISLSNWPLRKGLKRLIPRQVHFTQPGPDGAWEVDCFTFRWMWLRIDWGRI